jgi:hypothetical protein
VCKQAEFFHRAVHFGVGKVCASMLRYKTRWAMRNGIIHAPCVLCTIVGKTVAKMRFRKRKMEGRSA